MAEQRVSASYSQKWMDAYDKVWQIEQVKLGFTRACRSIDKLGKKWLKTWQN